VIFKKKRNPIVQSLDFSKPYTGKRIAVYTAIYGNYDTIPEPLYADPMCDYYIFTDKDIPEGSIWKKEMLRENSLICFLQESEEF